MLERALGQGRALDLGLDMKLGMELPLGRWVARRVALLGLV